MRTILIVDDEPAARYGLRRALEAKYRVAEADSAEAAREALPREQPDLVLLDVVLPGQDGLSFLRWMREQGSEVPVLIDKFQSYSRQLELFFCAAFHKSNEPSHVALPGFLLNLRRQPLNAIHLAVRRLPQPSPQQSLQRFDENHQHK